MFSFLSEFRVNLQQGGYTESGERAGHDPDKEKPVSLSFLHPSGNHARKHHAQCHESRANGIVGSLVIPVF